MSDNIQTTIIGQTPSCLQQKIDKTTPTYKDGEKTDNGTKRMVKGNGKD